MINGKTFEKVTIDKNGWFYTPTAAAKIKKNPKLYVSNYNEAIFEKLTDIFLDNEEYIGYIEIPSLNL